ncbi:MAG: hypothetical protein MZV64_42810 [Ignavibacteriales bacterium]|nr:hypothetical protein [Ignavibacteriales bacterium]
MSNGNRLRERSREQALAAGSGSCHPPAQGVGRLEPGDPARRAGTDHGRRPAGTQDRWSRRPGAALYVGNRRLADGEARSPSVPAGQRPAGAG